MYYRYQVGISPTAPTVVMSDGERTWVEPRPAYDTPRGNPALQPPTVFARTERSPAEVAAARDLWFFDTRGYLVVKGVMDAAWLGAANEAFDAFATRPERIRLVPEVRKAGVRLSLVHPLFHTKID